MSVSRRRLPTVVCLVVVASMVVVDLVTSEDSSYVQTLQGQEVSRVPCRVRRRLTRACVGSQIWFQHCSIT